MIIFNPATINDLLALKKSGAPVSLTSHPGNASLYKQSLWSCGIPEYLFDITCCKADANNWPMHRICNGEAMLLVDESRYETILHKTSTEQRYITAYQYTKTGERLGRAHVRAMQQLYPESISSCSQLMLREREHVYNLLAYFAETKPGIFKHFIDAEGIKRPIAESGIGSHMYADTCIRVFEELNHLLFSDIPITTYGGVCYEGPLVAFLTMLVQYWETGRYDRYDLSGPDMIKYTRSESYRVAMRDIWEHARRWSPSLVPERIIWQILPGTVARVGYVPGHYSEAIMQRKKLALLGDWSGSTRQEMIAEAVSDNDRWPIKIQPSSDCYFSQYDGLRLGHPVVVDDYWKNISFNNLSEELSRASSILRIR